MPKYKYVFKFINKFLTENTIMNLETEKVVYLINENNDLK